MKIFHQKIFRLETLLFVVFFSIEVQDNYLRTKSWISLPQAPHTRSAE